MTVEDPARLASLWQEQLSLIAQTDRRSAVPQSLQDWRDGMAALVVDSRAAAFVAVDEPDLAGYIVGWEPPLGLLPGVAVRTAILGEVVLDLHRYRAGAARLLVEAVRAEFADRGVDSVVALSSRQFATGQAFWRGIGGVEWMDGFWLK